MITEPAVFCVSISEMLSVIVSMSVSFARTSNIVAPLPSATSNESASAIGGSLIGFTVMLTDAVLLTRLPSLALYVNESSPLN